MDTYKSYLKQAARKAEEVVRLRKTKLTHEEIAGRVRVTRQRVGQILAEKGLK